MHGSSIDVVDTPTLKEQALRKWLENPYHTAKSLCTDLGVDYVAHGGTLRTYLWQFKRQFKNGSPQVSHNLPVAHRAVFECSKVVLSEEREEAALVHKWRQTSNRNRSLLFRGRNGSIHWFRNGHVLIYLRGRVPFARALELFWAAFGFLGDKECDRLSKLISPFSRHTEFYFGVPLPRMDIRYYEPTHGLRIVVDGTHPKSLELVESQPLYMQPVLKVLNGFAENIQSHGKLINDWRAEAEVARAKREDYGERIAGLEVYLGSRRQSNAVTNPQPRPHQSLFMRLCIWLNKDISFGLRTKGLVSQ